MIVERDIIVPRGGRPRDPNSRRSRGKTGGKAIRKFDRPFIGWDGEGYTDETGRHHYMMLVASTDDYILAPEGQTLSTFRCFDLFLRVARDHPKHNHVIFAGGYDFNMILSNLNRQDCERLHRTGRLFFGPYKIEHRHRKSVSIFNRNTGEHVIIYDCWPFFQTSFVKTLRTWGITEELEKIEAGKLSRSQFQYGNHQEILAYCQAELRSLVTLMEQFRDGLRETDIVLNRWDGPGAVAGALYNKHSTKIFKREMSGPLEAVNKAAQRAYFGGRIEQIQFGNHKGETFYYDVNSAYPAAIAELPSLASGKWRKSKSKHPPVIPGSLYHLKWSYLDEGEYTEEPFYPLPFRRPDGTISFFIKGRGWFHSPEYALVRDDPHVEVVESYVYDPCTDERPFDWVQEMYDLRREWKSQGKGEEKILKLGLNSLYGKMVQQLGWSKDRGLPPYHQLEWGGFVTSYTRAKLYEAAATNPSAVVGFETDGLITTEPLSVDLSSDLGGWGCEEYEGVTYAQPGVYWLLRDSEWIPKHRGFDPGTLTRAMVLEAWSEWKSWVVAQSTRFIGMGLALNTDFSLWNRWETKDRDLTVFPLNPKREHPPGRGGCQGYCIPVRGPGSRTFPPPPSETLHTTKLQWDNPGYWDDTDESEPYPLVWRNTGRYTFSDLLRDRDTTTYWEENATL